MAAYAGAVSVSETLWQLLDSPNYPYDQHVINLGDRIHCLILFLQDNREVKREFEIQIRDTIYEVQDIVDTYISSIHDFLSPSEAEISNQNFCRDLERLIQKINSLALMTTEDFKHQTLDRKISNSIWKNYGEIEHLDSRTLVGRNFEIFELVGRLTIGSDGLKVVPIVGINGMGKTAVAETILGKRQIRKHFAIIAWTTVPIEYQKREVLLHLLESMQEFGDGIFEKTDDELAKDLYNLLKKERYLVLLDDIRDVAVWNDLKKLFPDYHNRSRIILTTRNINVARIAGTPYLLNRLSDKDILTVLQLIVFREEPFPQELFVIAKDIARSCKGLPHAADIAGRLFRCAKLSVEYWEIVLSSINTCDNYDNLIKALVSLTYKHLPQQLKACLLYMAMFPYGYWIHALKLMDLWIAEGFIQNSYIFRGSKVDMDTALCCFNGLYSRNLISYIITKEIEGEAIKISEEVFHDFIMKTAEEENFFLIINKAMSYGDFVQEEYTYNQRRRLFISKSIVPLVIHNNYSSNTSISNARSLLYYGKEPQYPLIAWFHFKLLKVLDILPIRFYQFPPDILKSIQLRYLALSYNGQLPSAVCKLRYLQVLIVFRDSLKYSGLPWYLPVEIWNMNRLSHLQVEGSDLPDIPSDTNLKLENLLKLTGMSAHSCTRQILERIPNLTYLVIEIVTLADDESLSFFGHLHILNKLRLFKCYVLYPNVGSHVIPAIIPCFPSTLKFLTLKGFGFPWIYISTIAAGLPNLKRLDLQNYAFQGPEWEVKKDEFPNLAVLVLEDMDLKNWILADQACFPMLIDLLVRHCYKLQEIPYAIGDIPTLKMIHVSECSTSAMKSVLKIKEEKLSRGNDSVKFELYSSRDK